MDTKIIEKFSIKAREQLLKDMKQQLYAYALDDAGRAEYGAEADTIRGTVLSSVERSQRTALFWRVEREGVSSFTTTMAYTWFNRLMAIRYMELAGYLPSHVRMLSAADGTFNPECLRVATTLNLPGLDRAEVTQLIQAGDDEKLYRRILLAQCNELADFLPSVFGAVEADALTLPQNLLNKLESNVLYCLVTDIPEETWHDVEVMGWMYQFYNSELKRKYFDSKRKAAVEDIPPATQLFTPDWIVRYMVDNSLGRLWMLNFPESRLVERAQAEDPADRLMEYYIAPDEEHEDVIHISGPEDITFCDPACGSGHILVYAFRLLFAMYQERPSLILEKNLSGMEIDPRAAQIAELALAMCAREHDRRFFTRGVRADVRVLESVEIDADSLAPESPLRERSGLLEGLAHLSEIGSLLAPSEDDITALESELAENANDTIFASHTNERVEQALEMCQTLSRRFDVVVANPPYMGGSSFNPFMSKWMKKHYPDSCKDLCTAFIERGYTLARDNGYAAMVAMQSWMFLGSFEKMRGRIIDEKTILTMAHLGTRAFDAIGGEVVSVTADVLYNSKTAIKGAYFRLVDIVGGEPKRQKLLEAIQNPDCGYFYRADAATFHDIPGSPIAYWAGEGLHTAYSNGKLGAVFHSAGRLKTHDNERFIRIWWEPSKCKINTRWKPIANGGGFSRWFGMRYDVVDFCAEAVSFYSERGGMPNDSCLNQPGICWGIITSDKVSFRYKGCSELFSSGSPTILINKQVDEEALCFYLGLLNSSVTDYILAILNPTLNTTVGDILSLPNPSRVVPITQTIKHNLAIATSSWNSQETSWEFQRNPLI